MSRPITSECNTKTGQHGGASPSDHRRLDSSAHSQQLSEGPKEARERRFLQTESKNSTSPGVENNSLTTAMATVFRQLHHFAALRNSSASKTFFGFSANLPTWHHINTNHIRSHSVRGLATNAARKEGVEARHPSSIRNTAIIAHVDVSY